MALGESLVFYVLIGLAVAAAVALAGDDQRHTMSHVENRRGRVFAVIAAVFFWPLFVPMLLARTAPGSQSAPSAETGPNAEPDDALARRIALVDAELVAALASLDGWAEGAIARERVRINELRAAWRAQAQRIRDIDRVLAAVADEPTAANEDEGDASVETASRVAQSTRARRENFARLRRVRDRAERDLAATLESVRELVSMIHLAKFTGEPASRADELVTQIAAAVEGLSEVAAWNALPAGQLTI